MPPEVCKALGLQTGDLIAYEIDGDQVTVSKGKADEGAIDEKAIQPLIDAALDDTRPSTSLEAGFAEVRARFGARHGQKDAA